MKQTVLCVMMALATSCGPPIDKGKEQYVEVVFCPEGKTVCGSACLDAQTNPTNCGYCGHVCAGGVCTAGRCNAGVTDGGLAVCSQGLTACGLECVDAQTDNNNCGTCGNVCPVGMCNMGRCPGPPPDMSTPPDMVTLPDMVELPDLVVLPDLVMVPDLIMIPDMTILVDMSTPPDLSPQLTPCVAGQTVCSHACVDTQADPNNCNGCGNMCPMGQACIHTVQGGVCMSPPDGFVQPDLHFPPIDLMVVTATDMPAPSPDQATVITDMAVTPADGSTPPPDGGCAMGLSLCGTSCVNLQTDNNNCGTCQFDCRNNSTCQNGQCKCTSLQAWCVVTTDAGSVGNCTNIQTDSANCGGCGIVCPMGRPCNNWMCGEAP